jgi:mitogen-activated protein kinase kinase kinase
MAMLATKSPYPTPSLGGSSSQASAQYNSTISSYRNHASNARTDHTMFASPTESEFSEIYDAPDAVRYVPSPPSLRVLLTDLCRHWDEDKVADWLKRINCSQYVELFKRKCTTTQP